MVSYHIVDANFVVCCSDSSVMNYWIHAPVSLTPWYMFIDQVMENIHEMKYMLGFAVDRVPDSYQSRVYMVACIWF